MKKKKEKMEKQYSKSYNLSYPYILRFTSWHLKWTSSQKISELDFERAFNKTKQQVSWDYFSNSWNFMRRKPWLTAENLQILEVRSKSKKIWKQKANTSIYKTNEDAKWWQNEETKKIATQIVNRLTPQKIATQIVNRLRRQSLKTF